MALLQIVSRLYVLPNRDMYKRIIAATHWSYGDYLIKSFSCNLLFRVRGVELAGVEPASKQGNHTLSTRLFQPLVFV